MVLRKLGRLGMPGYIVAFAFSVVVGCGGGGGGGRSGDDGANEGGEGDLVTLDSLSDAEKQEFEAWKRRPLKACAWFEAFPELARQYPDQDGSAYPAASPLIDVARFVEHLQASSGGLPVLKDGDKLVLFEKPWAASSLERMERSSSRVVNGRGTVFKASAQRDDGECVITLGEQEVFRGYLADGAPAALSYDPAQPAGAAAQLAAVQQRTDHTTGGTAYVIGRTDGRPLLASAVATLSPGAWTVELLASHFGIGVDQAGELFRPASGAYPPDTASLLSMTTSGGAVEDLSGTTFFAPGVSDAQAYLYETEPVAGTSMLAKLLAPGTARLDLLYVPLLPSDQLVRIEATVAITSPQGQPVAQLASLRLGGGRARADADAIACFRGRHAASAPFLRRRSYDGVQGPCRMLSPDLIGALAGAPESIAIVVQEVQSRGSGATYDGWDGALVDVVDGMLTRGKALSELESGVTFSQPRIDLAAYLAAVPEAEARRALQRPLVGLAFDQYFYGDPLAAAERSDVLATLRKAAVPFRDSVAEMLSDLVTIWRQRGLQAARCGAGLDDGRISAIEAVLADASAYAYGKGFAGRMRGATLQACYQQADLDRAAAALAAARKQTADEEAQQHGFGWQGDHQALVDQALDERWTSDVYANAADVLAFGLASEFGYCGTYATLSEQVACAGAGGAAWLSASPGRALDPAFGGRYAALARDLRARFLDQLANDISTRVAIQMAYFDGDGLWLALANDAFTARRNQLFGLLDELRAATTISAQVDVRMRIEALLQQ